MSDEWVPPESFPRRDLYILVLAAERALRGFRERTPSRKSAPKDKVEAERWKREDDEQNRLLAEYRARVRDWMPEPPAEPERPRRESTRPAPESNDDYWSPVRSGRQVRVVPCPQCRDVRHMVGPTGDPERRCWACNNVWTPEPPKPPAPRAADADRPSEAIVMAAVP